MKRTLTGLFWIAVLFGFTFLTVCWLAKNKECELCPTPAVAIVHGTNGVVHFYCSHHGILALSKNLPPKQQ